MKIFVLGEEDTVLGFALAGVEGEMVASPEAALAALDRVLSRKDIGLLLVGQSVASATREPIARLKATARYPIVLEIPERRHPLARVPAREMIRRAVGVRI